MFATQFVLRISLHRQMIKYWLFFQKMRLEKLYKNYRNKTYCLLLMVSSILKTRRKYVIVLPPTIFNMIKMFGRLLYFSYISASENDSMLIFFQKNRRRKLYKSHINKLRFHNKKSSNIFIIILQFFMSFFSQY